MDIAEKKKEYDALKALSRWIGIGSAVALIVGMLWLSKILVVLGLLGGFAGTSQQLYARYRFGLIKNFKRWIIYQSLYSVFIIILVITIIALDFSV
ncbi:hypothetical protein G3570_02825 [Balneolaceae bacterium YR4-1]|uniref:Uncharacterized protein n=1 Tax=Halalkalibaculum roseum TaxID=2709311 RepID=A0A6M1SJT3_9BACT|nr:hypothetical protein [Halalkalibaculum roseum]NGP75551.1 hypothetical protein [Halalkalibaculum roseum]